MKEKKSNVLSCDKQVVVASGLAWFSMNGWTSPVSRQTAHDDSCLQGLSSGGRSHKHGASGVLIKYHSLTRLQSFNKAAEVAVSFNKSVQKTFVPSSRTEPSKVFTESWRFSVT